MTARLCKPRIHPVEPVQHVPPLVGDLGSDLFEPLVDLVKAFVDLLEPAVHFLEALVDLLEPAVNADEAFGLEPELLSDQFALRLELLFDPYETLEDLRFDAVHGRPHRVPHPDSEIPPHV